MRRFLLLPLLFMTAAAPVLLAKYKSLPIEVKPAADYAAHQDFQNIVIGAQAYVTDAEIRQVFDTNKLWERDIMPVLVVIENNNDFAISLSSQDVFVIGPDGKNVPSIPVTDVLVKISSNKPLSKVSSPKDLQRKIKKEIRMDFDEKALQERTVAPNEKEYGFVFFPMPEEGSLSGTNLYFPEIINLEEREQLMFFEFPLKDSSTH